MENVKYADILTGINPTWSIKEKAKYVYTEICKKSSYDERFIYSKNPELLHQIYNKKVNVDEYINPKLICKTLNDVYSELLNRLGIRNEIIVKSSVFSKVISAEDVALIFYDEDNLPIFTSIAADIQRCKYGMRTQFFGGCDENYEKGKKSKVFIIKSDELRNIDETIGFITKSGIYSDQVFDMISREVKQTNEFRKFLSDSGLNVMRKYLKETQSLDNLSDSEIRDIVSNLSLTDIIKLKMNLSTLIPNDDKTTGPIENKRYSIQLLKSTFFNKTEQKKYDCFDMVKEDGDEVKVLSILRFNLEPEPLYYLYSEEKHQYVLLPYEDALRICEGYTDKNNQNLKLEEEGR